MRPLFGLTVRFEGCRDCCSNTGTIEPGGGDTFANLICSGCGTRRGTLSGKTYEFLTAIVQKFGAPSEPIVLRRGQVRPLTDELSAGNRTGNTGAHPQT
jgi:hypothetical protein